LKLINPNPFTTRPEIVGTFGVVASTHWIATGVGMGILERGGNAFDAAVATAFALQVVEPHLNGPGGDVPLIFNSVKTGKTEIICGQGSMPAGATIAHYRSLGLDLIPGTGLLPACVPGTFDAYMLMLRDYGTIRVRDVLAPAIGYWMNGHPLLERVSATIATVADNLRQNWPTSAAVYLPDNNVPKTASLFRNTAVGNTYSRILKEAEAGGGGREVEIERARKIWSQGFVAEAIDRFYTNQEIMDVSGRRHRGVLRGDDMAKWKATVETPLAYDYGRYTVHKAGPWAQSPAMLQQLALLKGFNLDGADPTSADFVHTLVEASKLAFADREAFYGDPDFVDVPMQTLLSDAYNADRRKLIDGGKASLELRPGKLEGYGGVVKLRRADGARAAVAASGAGEPTVGRLGQMSGDTVHFDIIDTDGNMVSSTPSGGWLHGSPVVPELGFPISTRGQMFWLEEGLPGSLAPGKRPRTTLTPTLAHRDGEPYMVWGTPGGDQQDQWITQMFLRHVHCGMNLQEAIDAPAWHSEHFPSSFWPRTARPGVLVLEGRVPAETAEALRRRGHEVEMNEAWSEGRLTAATREDPWRKAGANPRGMQGYAAGR
jgi:gamma-glutamyltranspeptidase/glutathione hydrolase